MRGGNFIKTTGEENKTTMEEAKEPKQVNHIQELNQEAPVSTESVKIGDLVLTSAFGTIDHLCGLAVSLLQSEAVKDYLSIFKVDKIRKETTYTD